MNHRWTFNQVGRVPNNLATRLATKTIMRLTIKLTVICVRPNTPPESVKNPLWDLQIEVKVIHTKWQSWDLANSS